MNPKYKRSKRLTIAVFVLLRAAVIFCMFRQLLWGNYQNVLLCIFSLIVMSVPALLRTKLHLRLPGAAEIAIALFVFAAEILGEIANFYGQVPFWDTMLHTVNGFLMAALGFNVVDLLNIHVKGVKLPPLFVALVSFCFSMTVGVLWEFFEFSGDRLARTDMQKDRIIQSVASVEFNPARERI